MITLEQAKNLSYRETLCQVDQHGSDGCHVRWRVNGKPQTWKRNPGRVFVPVKHGLYDYGAITENDLDKVTLAKECDCGNS